MSVTFFGSQYNFCVCGLWGFSAFMLIWVLLAPRLYKNIRKFYSSTFMVSLILFYLSNSSGIYFGEHAFFCETIYNALST